MEEVWKPMRGHESLYEVSNLGRIRSIPKTGFRKRAVLAQHTERHGYKRIRLTDGNVKFSALVHRIVAEAFVPNPDEKPIVNHIDGDKGNNRADNLEWVTYKENHEHAVRTGLIPKNQIMNAVEASRKVPRKNSVMVRRSDGVTYRSISEAARAVGVDRAVLSRAVAHVRGKRTAGGYEWEYVRRK